MEKDTLIKMTVPKLREEALKIEGLTGVHGMNKSDLLKALFKHFNIPEDKKMHKDTTAFKKKLKELRQKKIEIKATGDRKQIEILRRRMHALKRKTRV